jgi:uncharacterized metal-binding protein
MENKTNSFFGNFFAGRKLMKAELQSGKYSRRGGAMIWLLLYGPIMGLAYLFFISLRFIDAALIALFGFMLIFPDLTITFSELVILTFSIVLILAGTYAAVMSSSMVRFYEALKVCEKKVGN